MDIKLFGINEEKLNSKLFNIFIGISLGNKFLSKELAEEYLRFALDKTKEKVAVLIADEIDAINWEIFRDFSKKDALEKVRNKGEGLAEMFQNIINKIERETGKSLKVNIIKWSDIKTKNFLSAEKFIAEEYKNNFEFKKRVLYFVDEYSKMRKKSLSDEERDKLATYIIAELPTLIQGIEYDKDLYQIVLYPTYVSSGMSEFVLDIQNGVYPNLVEELQINKPGKMIELYLNNFEK
jgi:tRNA-dependent cyclodipeptide synthase